MKSVKELFFVSKKNKKKIKQEEEVEE